MKLISSIILALLLLSAVYSCQQSDVQEKPNVIVIVTDDQAWVDLSIHGNTNLETPSMDQIAHNGARFERFYVCPVCSPTRAELLAGREAIRCGV